MISLPPKIIVFIYTNRIEYWKETIVNILGSLNIHIHQSECTCRIFNELFDYRIFSSFKCGPTGRCHYSINDIEEDLEDLEEDSISYHEWLRTVTNLPTYFETWSGYYGRFNSKN